MAKREIVGWLTVGLGETYGYWFSNFRPQPSPVMRAFRVTVEIDEPEVEDVHGKAEEVKK